MNTTPQPPTPRAALLGCLAMSALVASIVLASRNWFFGGQHSWWLVGALFLAPGFVAQLSGGFALRLEPPSEEKIREAFRAARRTPLRSIEFVIPQSWKYQKMGRGAHMLAIAELEFRAAIVIELTYLNETDINTLEGYLGHAVDFCRMRKANLVFNRLTKRWGLDVHEFADQGSSTYGQRVTFPFHGTEYGFQLRFDSPGLTPELIAAARKIFERFLDEVRIKPPPLERHSVFGGKLSIGLPPGFAKSKSTDADSEIWTDFTRNDCSVALKRMPANSALELSLLVDLARSAPRPAQAASEIPKAGNRLLTHISESGFGGYTYFQGTDTRGWFAVVGDMPSGARYRLVLDDKDPAQRPYFGTHHYQQMMFEVLSSLDEGTGRAKAADPYAVPQKAVQDAHGDTDIDDEDDDLKKLIAKAKAEGWEKLELDGKNIEALPDSIGDLSKLKELWLRRNFLTAIPRSIGNLKNLVILHLSGNHLSQLPDEITKLTKLQILGITNNQIASLPERIGAMGELRELHAGGNQLTELPTSIGNLKHAVKMNFCNNVLRSVPREMKQCTALKFIYLHGNHLNVSEDKLGPTWMDISAGATPLPPGQIISACCPK